VDGIPVRPVHAADRVVRINVSKTFRGIGLPGGSFLWGYAASAATPFYYPINLTGEEA
jgi:hypothetical protein